MSAGWDGIRDAYGRLPCLGERGGYRSAWTPDEVAQVIDVFGAPDTPETLDLFCPDDWEDMHEVVPEDELVALLFSERASLRRKAARWHAATEMGLSGEDAALFGARALWIIHEARENE